MSSARLAFLGESGVLEDAVHLRLPVRHDSSDVLDQATRLTVLDDRGNKRSGGSAGGESRGRYAADRVPVEIAVRHLLKHLRAKLPILQPRLDQQLLDAFMVPLKFRACGAGCRYFGLKIVHHVAHALIIGDRQPGCQVMHGQSLTHARGSSTLLPHDVDSS